MADAWKQYEGQSVNEEFHLGKFLGGSEHSGVFLTEYGEREPRKAAIKLVPVKSGNAEVQLSRWRLAAKLIHPHLLRLFEMGRCKLGKTDLLYLVMEYAEEDLSQILPQRPLTAAEARDMLEPVLDALTYIHSQGLVHGHIRPANVMAAQDQLKLSSDGLCRLGETNISSEKPGAYDPPEIPDQQFSPANDVWSLGMTLVETLTQQLPAWNKKENRDPMVPETLPAPFLEIARQCLRRDPQLRRTVAEIRARLQQKSSVPEKQTVAKPRAAPEKWRSNYFILAVAITLLLVAILAVPNLLKRSNQNSSASSIAPEKSPVPSHAQPPAPAPPRATRQPKPEQKSAAPAAESLAQKTRTKKKDSTDAAPSPASLRSTTPNSASPKSPSGPIEKGEVLQQILPDVSERARSTIRGIVRVSVRISVDSSGSVTTATLDAPGPSKYFADLALQAARRWEFAPAKMGGQNVSSEWLVRFQFESSGAKAHPVEVAP